MSSNEKAKVESSSSEEEDVCYRCLVVDSGPIIRHQTGMSSLLWKSAKEFYTVPAVLQEIRDAKARQHLESLPFTLQCRDASPEGIQAVIEFARQTGDYNSLSSVDLQVLGLLYDLEREGCRGDMSHIRTTPKRTIGLGKIESLGPKEEMAPVVKVEENKCNTDEQPQQQKTETANEFDPSSRTSTSTNIEEKRIVGENKDLEMPRESKSKSWAALVNPSAATTEKTAKVSEASEKEAAVVSFAKMALTQEKEGQGCQFSDAENDNEIHDGSLGSCSDEECDTYILEPDEVDQRKRSASNQESEAWQQERQSEFPTLAEAATVPYEGCDDDEDDDEETSSSSSNHGNDVHGEVARQQALEEAEEEERKRQALQPITKSGKLYNSFRKYGDLMKPKQPSRRPVSDTGAKKDVSLHGTKPKPASLSDTEETEVAKNESRIIGGMSFAGQGDDVEDDGEGWITSAKDIGTMKAAGALDPSRNPEALNKPATMKQPQGPAKNQRAACTTTDFAMQNVILQMNLELLSVDGMKIRKLKNWVTRCGACFKVYTNSENTGPMGKRLFCERCGSDMMQRIAASVDGKTGRLRLHLSKKYKHNLRGTKFSLPKPGTGNRFQGDLLLREDQLLTGAWNQKVKMRSGGKARNAAQSMFGADIATNVGCHTNAMSMDDIRVGFGRRNPNAAKGRERRGKKKKSNDKACGLRRY